MEAATNRYNELVERGEAALERLRSQSAFEDASARAQASVDQAVELTQEALGTVASQTRAVGERAAKLVGIELPKKAPAKKEGSGQEGRSGQEGSPPRRLRPRRRRPRRSPRSSQVSEPSHSATRTGNTLDSELPACYLGNSESTFWTVPHTLKA